MKKADIKITVYEMEDDFFVEVHKDNGMLEFWICHQNCGIKSFMFGIPALFITENNTIDRAIQANFTEYKNNYIQEYMQEE